MRITRVVFAILLACALAPATATRAAVKTIYIKPFSVIEGFKKTDPVGNLVKDYVSEYITESQRGNYAVISDDEVRQVMSNEELRMSIDACYDDACMKQLMKSIKTDYMIYGTVSFTEGKHVITVKLLDRSGGDVRIGRVKTLEFSNRLKLRLACKDLAANVVAGKRIDMDNYIEAEEKEAMKRVLGSAPYGLSIAYRFFTPLSAPANSLLKYYHGAALEYAGAFGKYAALFGGADCLISSGKTKPEFVMTVLGLGYKGAYKVTSILNEYYIGGRFGYPATAGFYPYAAVAAKGAWYRYTYRGSAKNHAMVGVDGSLGFAFPIRDVAAIFVEFRGSWGMLLDKAKTDMSGIGAGAGLTIQF